MSDTLDVERDAIVHEGGPSREPSAATSEPAPSPVPGAVAEGADGGYLVGSAVAGVGGVEGEGADAERRIKRREAEGIYLVSDDWRDALAYTDNGGIKRTVRNVSLVLLNDERFRERLRLNRMTLFVELDGAAIGETDLTAMRIAIEAAYRFSPAETDLAKALALVAEHRGYDPRAQYLRALTWDGTERLNGFAERVFGSIHPLYDRFMGAFFGGAVKRVFEPGCVHQSMLVLMGRQGFYKSSFFRLLTAPYFSDTPIPISNTREAAIQVHAAWVHEVSECDGMMLGREDFELKRFISQASDNFRRPYERTTSTTPRTCVFTGTTNERVVLKDATGSRRYHLVEVLRPIDPRLLERERDQLWAEAVTRYRRREEYWLTPAEETQREELAEHYFQADPWETEIRRWTLDTSNLRRVETRNGERWACATADLYKAALGIERKDLTDFTAKRVARVMRRLGAQTDQRQRFVRATGLSPGRLGAPEAAYVFPDCWPPPEAIDSTPHDNDDFPT